LCPSSLESSAKKDAREEEKQKKKRRKKKKKKKSKKARKTAPRSPRSPALRPGQEIVEPAAILVAFFFFFFLFFFFCFSFFPRLFGPEERFWLWVRGGIHGSEAGVWEGEGLQGKEERAFFFLLSLTVFLAPFSLAYHHYPR
jgi:hypothetical protein